MTNWVKLLGSWLAVVYSPRHLCCWVRGVLDYSLNIMYNCVSDSAAIDVSGKVWMASFLSPLHSATWISKLPIFLSKSWKSIFILCEKWYSFALCSILPCAKQLPDLFFFCSNNALQYGHPFHMHGRQNLDRSLVLWTKHCNVTSFATNIAKLNN